jgi:hypothetical protein
VRMLINHAADVCRTSRRGETCLMLAASKGHVPVVRGIGGGIDACSPCRWAGLLSWRVDS